MVGSGFFVGGSSGDVGGEVWGGNGGMEVVSLVIIDVVF